MKNLLLISLFVVFYSCNMMNREKSTVNDSEKGIKETVIKDIPEALNDSTYRNKNKSLEKLLGIPSLENGFNEFQIRIWFSYNIRDTQQLVVLKKANSNWTGEFFSVFLNLNKEGELESISKHTENRVPKWGWAVFIDSLKATEIETLPNYSKFLPDYDISTHSDAITIEIANTKSYRVYQYPDFEANSWKYSELKKFEQALNLINEQFNFDSARKKILDIK